MSARDSQIPSEELGASVATGSGAAARKAGAPQTTSPTNAPGAGAASVEFSTRTGRKLRRFALGAALVLLVGFAVVFLIKAYQRHELAATSAADISRRPVVNVIMVRGGAGSRALTLPGETAAWFESVIYARVNGYVGKWYSDIGDHVRQGQTLATIETPELDAQLVAARAQLNAAEAQVRVRQAEAELATTTYERWRDSPKGVVSEQEREEKKADYDSAEAKLNAARAQVALNQADVDRYVALTEFKHVTAPYDGTIVERRIDIGNLVTAGSTASTSPLYRLTQDRPIRVFVDVPQSASGELMRPGAPVQIRASNLPGRVFSGTVTRTSQAINPQARTLKVEVDLANREGTLVPGMYVDIAFQLQNTDLFQVPAAAMMFRTSGPQVAVVEADGHVRFRKVTIARDEGNVVELGTGVAAGDRVVLNISSQIADGDLVAANEVSSAAGAPGAAPATAPSASQPGTAPAPGAPAAAPGSR
ncbi:MAG TPA: efflux RND transporter periplasmic adaptor subunit [Burkholderiaceae bacterium]|nr:efflux RND transporter periplasmic adaptor subunit [Burkholderiaceae bacterium]